MLIQAVSSRNPIKFNPALKKKNQKHPAFSYQDFLTQKNSNFKNQIDHFLKFSKMASSSTLSPALDVLDTKSCEETETNLSSSLKDNKPIRQILDNEGRVTQFISSDGTFNYKIDYQGSITKVTNMLTGEVQVQEVDERGRPIREIFPCGLEISWKFDGDLLSEVTLPDQSKVIYEYVDENRVNIRRVSPEGKILYQNSYNIFNDNFKETLIGSAGTLEKQYDEASKILTSQSDHLQVIDQYDEDQNLVSRTLKDLKKNTTTTLKYPIGDLLAGEDRELDDLGRVTHYNGFTCTYDEKGRLTQKRSADQVIHYGYDAFDRLFSVEIGDKRVDYTYDLLGRRFSKTVIEKGETRKEFYLYQGVNQIGVYNGDKELLHLRVLGLHYHTHLPFAIAIESQGKAYAPIYSSNFNVLQLVDKDSQEVFHYESLSPFGENLQTLNPITPWIFATKYYDKDTGLVDFGDRQYDPSIKQWTSADPDPRATEDQLYSYCNNNPFKYIDPNGQWGINFGFVIPIGAGAIRGAGTGAAGGIWGMLAGMVVGAFVGLAVESAQKKINEDKMEDNRRPNKQYKDAAKEVEKKLGRKLTPKELDEFHNFVTGQGYGYHEMIEEGFHLFDDRYRNN